MVYLSKMVDLSMAMLNDQMVFFTNKCDHFSILSIYHLLIPNVHIDKCDHYTNHCILSIYHWQSPFFGDPGSQSESASLRPNGGIMFRSWNDDNSPNCHWFLYRSIRNGLYGDGSIY